MAKEKTIILKVESDDAVESIEKVGNEIDDTKNKSSELTDSLMDNIRNFKVLGVSINSVTKSLKLLRISLIATGIGAIAVAVGTLAAAFLSTQKGADALNSILTPLTTVLQRMWGIVQNLASIFVDITQGEAAWQDLGDAISGVGDELAEAYEQGKKLHELNILIQEDDLNLITARAKLRRQSEEAKLIADDTTKSYKERKAAAELAIQSEESLAQLSIAALNRQIKATKIKFAQNDTDRKTLKELITLEAERDIALAASATRQKEAQNKLNALNAQYKTTDPKDRVDPITGTSINQLEEFSLGLEFHLDDITRLQRAAANQSTRLASETANANVAIAEEEAAAKEKAMQATAQAIYTLSDIAGKETVAGKGLAIAAALINTYTGITASLKVGGFAGIAQSIAVGLAGFAAVKNIISTPIPGGHGSATAPSTASAPTTTTQAPAFNIVGASDTNQLTQAINERDSQPVRAYVVGSDVSSQQALDRNTVENATVI